MRGRSDHPLARGVGRIDRELGPGEGTQPRHLLGCEGGDGRFVLVEHDGLHHEAVMSVSTIGSGRGVASASPSSTENRIRTRGHRHASISVFWPQSNSSIKGKMLYVQVRSRMASGSTPST